jgi:hypothetical protein
MYRWDSPEAPKSEPIVTMLTTWLPAHVVADRNAMLALPDTRPGTVDGEAEALEHVGEEHVVFHAVAASVAGDEFVVDGLGVEGDGVGRWRIVEGEVLEGD